MDNEGASPIHSPERRLSKIFKPNGRRGEGLESSTTSLAPSDAGSEHSGIRKSFDRGLDKLKDRRRDSSDKDGDSSQSSSKRSGLSKLVPSRSRRRKKKSKDVTAEGEGALLNVPGQNNSKLHLQQTNASIDSFGNTRSGGSSLLLTDDSEPDMPASRPDLASRASHKGFLTFSSPLIAAGTVEPLPSSTQSNPALPLQPRQSAVQRSQTIPAKSAADRPPSAASSKPSITVTSFPLDDHSGPPSTFITPPTPAARLTSHKPKSNSSSSIPTTGPGAKPSATPKEVLTHRRVRSTTSTGKRNGFNSPLTPTVEEAKTPGGTVIQPSNSSGFFSGFFNAAQNAAAQLSNSFTPQPGNNRARSATQASDPQAKTLSDGGESTRFLSDGASELSVQPEPAVATLGAGNLSLTHLGITDHKSEDGDMATHTETALGDTVRLGHNPSASTEEASAADAVSAAYSNNDIGEKTVPVAMDSTPGRPRSIGSNLGGEQTPPRSLIALDNDGGSVLRAGSVRSRLSGHRRKHRNSSTAGAGAIAAAVAASHGAIAHPANRRPTGFQVANSRRNKEFHQLFKSVPQDDHLIEDYSAALQRDILLHGRFYISERHVCFSSNILGWVTNLVISFDEVLAMEKKSTAMIFPNAIVIQTLHAKNIFASFISRDPTYDLLVRIWKIGHPNIKATETGHALDEGADGEKGENGEGAESDDEDDDESDEDDDGADTHDAASSAGRAPSLSSDHMEGQRQVSRTAGVGTGTGAAMVNSPGRSTDPISSPPPGGAPDFAGPAQHGPTECSDQDSHYDKQCLDALIPAPIGKVFSLMFGAQSIVAMRKFLVDEQKSSDLQLDEGKEGMSEEVKTTSFSYIKPLFAPVGPKQTKCIVSQNLDAYDLEKAISVTCSTSTPDVPSGNIFVVKTRYCLMWGPGNQTRLLMSTLIEWSGKSWLKGPIDKAAGDGQVQYGKDLAAFLKSQVASRVPTKAVKSKGKGKKKKTSTDTSGDASRAEKPTNEQKKGGWGPLEPIRAVAEPIFSLAGDFVSPIMVLSVLLVIVTFLWMRQGGRAEAREGATMPVLAAHQRLAAYDQLWSREETELWDWLELRLDMQGVESASAGSAGSGRSGMVEKVREKRMQERDVDEAIRTTEERLKELKVLVERQRGDTKEL